MRMIPVVVLFLQLAAAGVAESQTFDDLSIWVRGFEVTTDGGEKSSVALSTGPVVIGKPVTGVFWMWGCGYFSVSSEEGYKKEGATGGWRVEITPTRVANHAVTFRLRWVRAVDSGKGFTPASEDVELTLRPGEARPMASVPVPPGATTFDSGPCKASAASLRVSTEYYPDEEVDRRLIAADMWLIERLANGTERSQLQALRGLPNRPIPFYFDSIIDGTVSLDILGQVVARPGSGAMEVSLQTRSRWGESSFDWRQGRSLPTRWLESVIQVKPGEVVEVALPRLDEKAGAFANRAFSIRIRARQVR